MHRQGPEWWESCLPQGHSENTLQKVVAPIDCTCWKAHLIPLPLPWHGNRQLKIPLRLGLVRCGAVPFRVVNPAQKEKAELKVPPSRSPGECGRAGASLGSSWSEGGECWLLWEQEFGLFCIQVLALCL